MKRGPERRRCCVRGASPRGRDVQKLRCVHWTAAHTLQSPVKLILFNGIIHNSCSDVVVLTQQATTALCVFSLSGLWFDGATTSTSSSTCRNQDIAAPTALSQSQWSRTTTELNTKTRESLLSSGRSRRSAALVRSYSLTDSQIWTKSRIWEFYFNNFLKHLKFFFFSTF